MHPCFFSDRSVILKEKPASQAGNTSYGGYCHRLVLQGGTAIPASAGFVVVACNALRHVPFCSKVAFRCRRFTIHALSWNVRRRVQGGRNGSAVE